MASDPRIRASDADRDRAAAALQEHLTAGRLTTGEFDDRLDKAYAAKTLGELDELMADLPAVGVAALPDASMAPAAGIPAWRRPARPVATGRGRLSPAWRAAWGSWLTISLVLVVIWLVSGASGGPWFLWVVLPLGAVLLARQVTGAPPRRQRLRAAPRRSHGHHHSDPARQ